MFAGLLVAVISILLTRQGFETSHEYGSHAPDSTVTDSDLSDRGGDPQSEAGRRSRSKTTSRDSSSCLTLAQLESHPLIVEDARRFDAVGDSDPSIAAYRGFTEQELRAFAAQGESSAMVVLGAMSVMRARGWPPEQAVPYLLFEDRDLMVHEFSHPHSEETRGHMAQAREWYYKAALHGRVMVLSRVGRLLSDERGGPVGLGWIDAAEYDGLSEDEKEALSPWWVYYDLSFEVAPALKTGPHGGSMLDILPLQERRRAIVEQLKDRFFRDLEDAGLELVSVPESVAPPIEDLMNLLCEGELDWLETVIDDVR